MVFWFALMGSAAGAGGGRSVRGRGWGRQGVGEWAAAARVCESGAGGGRAECRAAPSSVGALCLVCFLGRLRTELLPIYAAGKRP